MTPLMLLPHGRHWDRWFALLRSLYGLRYWPRLNPPQTFNEHFLHQKLHFEPWLPAARQLTDKLGFKQQLDLRGLGHVVVPTLAEFDRVDQAAAALLPTPSVLKPSHSSGRVLFIDGPQPRRLSQAEQAQAQGWMTHNYYLRGREPNYRGLRPRLLLEPKLDFGGPEAPCDHKIFCAWGEPFLIQVDAGRFSSQRRRQQFYSPDWQLHPFVKGRAQPDRLPRPRPAQLAAALQACQKLAADFPLTRVDAYFLADGRLLLGEITFFPGNCASPFRPASADADMGRLIHTLLAQHGARPR